MLQINVAHGANEGTAASFLTLLPLRCFCTARLSL